jgi:hypothetical protein
MGGINAVLQMLKTIPDVEKMFSTRSYSKGCAGEMPICEEIADLFESENMTTSAAYLRFLIRSQNVGGKEDFSTMFRIIYESVKKELECSNLQSKDVWGKFRRKYRVTCKNCARLRLDNDQSPEMMQVTPLEGSKTTLTRLINCFKVDPEENQDKECLLCHASRGNRFLHLPSFLLIQVTPRPSSGSVLFPENKMTLVNGNTYKLSCIIDHDDVTAVVDNNTWIRCDSTKHTPATREDVKNPNNTFFMYVKSEVYRCDVAGCPLDKVLESRKELRRHMQKEHPRCSNCKETFLLSCLYEEHLRDGDSCPSITSCSNKNIPTKEGHSEVLQDSGLDSMSDSTFEEPVKVIIKKTYSGQFEVKSSTTGKRKAEISETSEPSLKKCKSNTPVDMLENITSENKESDCKNAGCPHTGNHWCQYPPVLRLENHSKCSGTILREKSLVKGVQKFVPFNNSFLETLGCQFYFKNKGAVIEITSYCLGGEEYEYQLTLASKNTHKMSPMRAKVGERRRVAAFELDSFCVEYQLVVYSKL